MYKRANNKRVDAIAKAIRKFMSSSVKASSKDIFNSTTIRIVTASSLLVSVFYFQVFY